MTGETSIVGVTGAELSGSSPSEDAGAGATNRAEASDVHREYGRIIRRRVAVLLGMAAICAIAFCLDVATGPSNLPLGEVIDGLLRRGDLDGPTSVIIWEVRLPYAIMALLVGASLSLAGAEMQTILNNPLASPFTLGVSAAATFGAALAVVAGLSLPGVSAEWAVAANAFALAFGSMLLLQAASRLRGASGETLVLFGIALVFSFNALVAMMQFVAGQEALQNLVFWSMGSMTRADWPKLTVLTLVVVCVVPFSFAAAWRMTALRLGEERARSFGVDVGRLRFASLFRVSLLAGAAVAFVGTIGFVGLVGPHIARLLIGEDHRFYLPASVLTGTAVLSLSSVLSKVVIPGVVLPTGIVTSLIGVPIFLALIFRRRVRG
jgi:iron complex transport system permease protein